MEKKPVATIILQLYKKTYKLNLKAHSMGVVFFLRPFLPANLARYYNETHHHMMVEQVKIEKSI